MVTIAAGVVLGLVVFSWLMRRLAAPTELEVLQARLLQAKADLDRQD